MADDAAASGGKRVKIYFKKVARDWDSMRQSFFTEEVRDAAIERARLTPDSEVGDVGTGTGFMLVGLAPLVKKAWGFDNSPEMLEVARANLAGMENVELCRCEGANIPLPDCSLDAVFGNMYLHHCSEPGAAIAEMARVLKPGGRLVITDMDRHERGWLKDEMADLWLGFDRAQLSGWLDAAELIETTVEDTGKT